MNIQVKIVKDRFLRTILFTLVFLVSFMAISINTGAEESDTTQLRILHTNDIHAQITHFGKLAHYTSAMKEDSDIFLYLDAGDIFSGDPAVDIPKGAPIINLLNKVGLDAMGIGNHEFDYGVEAFNKNYGDSNFPWLSANMTVDSSITAIVQPEPYTIIEKEGIKIGVISLTQNPPATSPKNIIGIDFYDYNKAIEQYKSLRSEVDVLIGLNHIGYGDDQKLAKEFDIFDAIIGGHSHTKVNQPAMINGIPVVQTGSHLGWVGNLTLDIDNDSKEVTFADWKIDSVASMTEVDQEVQAVVDEYLAVVEEQMSVKIGETTGLSSSGKNARDVPLGNFWTDAMRHMTDADMAFTNAGGIRTSIDAGPLTVRNIFEVEPFNNQVAIINMTGQAIKDVIKYSFTRDGRNQMDLQTSGLHYTIITNSGGNYIDAELMIDGEPLEMDKVYKVAAPDYIGSGGSGYNFVGEVVTYESGLMTTSMTEYAIYLMEQNGIIDYKTEGRMKVEKESGSGQGQTITVAEAIANNEGSAAVNGYIVGHVVSGKAILEGPFADDFNYLLADDPNELDSSKMLAVQITAGFRGEFGLATNPNMIGEQVIVSGSLEKFHGLPGLKSPSAMEKIKILTIGEVRQQDVGSEWTVEGTVINVPGAWGGKTFYLNDGTGGILVYQFDFDVAEGDYIRLTGTLDNFNDEIQLNNIKGIEILKQNQALPEPIEVTPDQVSDATIGELVTLKGVTISSLEVQDNFGTFEFVANIDGESVSIRVDNRTGLGYDAFAFKNGDVIDITGLVGIYQGTYQVKPRYKEDIVAYVEPEEPVDPEEPIESIDSLLSELSETLEGYIDSDEVGGPLVNQLRNSIKQAEHHLNKGSDQKAIQFIEKFLKHLNNKPMQKFISTPAKEDLDAKANHLINQ